MIIPQDWFLDVGHRITQLFISLRISDIRKASPASEIQISEMTPKSFEALKSENI